MKHKAITFLYKIAIGISVLMLPSSCTEFLKEQAPSNLTPDNFYSIPDHAEAAIASVYADLRFMGGGAGIFSANWQLLEAMTGTSTTETAQNSDLNNLNFISKVPVSMNIHGIGSSSQKSDSSNRNNNQYDQDNPNRNNSSITPYQEYMY